MMETSNVTESRAVVGVVPLGPDRLVVEVVRRSWTGSVPTTAPAGVVVSRDPSTGRDEPGGMTARAAAKLARLLTVAAAQAAAANAASRGPAPCEGAS